MPHSVTGTVPPVPGVPGDPVEVVVDPAPVQLPSALPSSAADTAQAVAALQSGRIDAASVSNPAFGAAVHGSIARLFAPSYDAVANRFLIAAQFATAEYVRRIRKMVKEKFPEFTMFALAPDISTQVLNFGLPAPIDIQLIGAVGAEQSSYDMARRIWVSGSAIRSS